ncbi:MAG: SusF/SusE family outer membrane protein, partial [Clostridia bacterium]
VRNGDILEKPVVTTDFYIKGAKITSWKDVYSAQTKMTNKDDVYSLKIYLAKGDEFMFTSRNTIGSTVSTGTDYLRFTNLDDVSKKLFTATKSQNIIANAAGTYTFSYDKKSKVLKATLDEKELPVKADYYIDGTFAEGVKDWADYCFKSNFKLKAGTAGVYEIKNVKMKEGSQIIVQSFKAGATARGEWGKPSYTGLGSFNFSNLVDGGASFSAVDGKNLNIKVLKAGTYNITLDSYSGIVRITAVA